MNAPSSIFVNLLKMFCRSFDPNLTWDYFRQFLCLLPAFLLFVNGLAKSFCLCFIDCYPGCVGQVLNFFHWTHRKKKCLKCFPQIIICDTSSSKRGMGFSLFSVTSIHSIRKNTTKNSETRWKVTEGSWLKRELISK